MNHDLAEGKWQQIRGTVKKHWGKLSDDELTQAEGDFDYLVGRVQELYGLSRDEVRKEIDRIAGS